MKDKLIIFYHFYHCLLGDVSWKKSLMLKQKWFANSEVWNQSVNILKCLNIGTTKTNNFPFVPNGKLQVFGVPIFKHIRVGLHSEPSFVPAELDF